MKKIILLLSCMPMFIACITPPDYDDLSSEFIVSTNLDQTADFTSYATYYISDTIAKLGGTGNDTIWHDADATQIVAQIKQNMEARGYTYVQRHQNPDIAMAAGAVEVVTVDYYPGWWAGYPGWFPWDYPYYYPWSTVYAYDSGSVIIDAYDAKNAASKGQYRAIWGSVTFGALNSSDDVNLNRAERAIDQSFEQSPYFKAN
jgi:hypothetical protein